MTTEADPPHPENGNCADASLARLKTMLDRLGSLKPIQTREENLFQIGGRGHFENPTTQLLEFFLDPTRCHGFGSHVLEVLLKVADIPSGKIDARIPFVTQREVVIRDSVGVAVGRLDLVLEADSWILVLENKIRHQAVNDFLAYASFASGTGKKHELVLLSVKPETQPGWRSVLWSDFDKAIRAKIGLADDQIPVDKWKMFLREFLDNVVLESCEGRSMDVERFDFAIQHADSLFQAQELFEEFLREICERWTSQFRALGFEVRSVKRERMWEGKERGGWRCIPIRFVFGRPDMELVLKVFPSNQYGLNLYPRAGVGMKDDALRQLFPKAAKIEREGGYLACIVADADNLSLDMALENAIQAIARFQTRSTP